MISTKVAFKGLTGCTIVYVIGILIYRFAKVDVALLQSDSVPPFDTVTTMEMALNYTINELRRARFIDGGFTRIHISDECGFAYFTTLKVLSQCFIFLSHSHELSMQFTDWVNGNEFLIYIEDSVQDDSSIDQSERMRIWYQESDRFQSLEIVPRPSVRRGGFCQIWVRHVSQYGVCQKPAGSLWVAV